MNVILAPLLEKILNLTTRIKLSVELQMHPTIAESKRSASDTDGKRNMYYFHIQPHFLSATHFFESSQRSPRLVYLGQYICLGMVQYSISFHKQVGVSDHIRMTRPAGSILGSLQYRPFKARTKRKYQESFSVSVSTTTTSTQRQLSGKSPLICLDGSLVRKTLSRYGGWMCYVSAVELRDNLSTCIGDNHHHHHV